MKMKQLLALFACLILFAGVLPAFASEPEQTAVPANTGVLEFGATGADVEALQRRLTELGYYSGKITGNYLDGTRKCIRRFQQDYELPVTGIADAETLTALESAEARSLTHGDDGNDVKRLQQALKDLGYLDANATGKFRSATRSAVEAFQSHNGLEVTGTADLVTQRLLYSGNALRKGASPTPTPNPDEDLGDINDMVMAGDGEAVTQAWSRKYDRGDKGEDVKKIQQRLKELGFFDGPVSGNYMNQTKASVKAFQEHNGLRADGVCGEATWNMLFNTVDVLDISATPRPTPEPTPVPYAITVDVRNQAVIVYGLDECGEYTRIVRRMICSTGMKATPSDVGTWVLNGRRARWCYFGKWNSHAQYWTQINENIAFHSLIYNEVDYNALNVKSFNKLGQRASHGCVRLLVSDARWIYENIHEGVVVTITEDLPSDEELRHSVAAPPLNKSKTGPVTTPQPTPEPEYTSDGMPPQPFRKMKKGTSGEDVYWLQMKLTELGYYMGAVTGGYYSGTFEAVKAYQKANKLTVTGNADEKTLNKIYADVLAAAAECDASETTGTDVLSTVSPESTPAPTPSPITAPAAE